MKSRPFEEDMEELEEIVRRMETGEPSLSEIIENYSRGLALSKKCLRALERAEKAMDVMVRERDGVVEELRLDIEGDADAEG